MSEEQIDLHVDLQTRLKEEVGHVQVLIRHPDTLLDRDQIRPVAPENAETMVSTNVKDEKGKR